MDETSIERMISEQRDGGLSAVERARLEAALAADAALRRCAKEYARLDGMLRGWRALPVEAGECDLRGSVRARIEDDLAFTMSQRIDGVLDDATDRAAAVRFAGDATAGRVEDEMRRTQDLVESWRTMPQVDWARLHERFSSAVRREAGAKRGTRIVQWTTGLAAAAAIAVAAILGVRSMRTATPISQAQGPAPVARVAIDAPRSDGHATVTPDKTPPSREKEFTAPPQSHGLARGSGRPHPPRPAEDVPNF